MFRSERRPSRAWTVSPLPSLRGPDRSSWPVCLASRLAKVGVYSIDLKSTQRTREPGLGGNETIEIFFILLRQWTGSSAAACFGLDSGWTGAGSVALRCLALPLRARAPPPPGTAVVVPRIVSQLVCSSYCIGLVVVVQPATDRAPPGRTLHAALAFARARVINDRIVGGEQHGPG